MDYAVWNAGGDPASKQRTSAIQERHIRDYEPARAVASKRAFAGAPARVSVLVTARNYSRFLPQCLHSILAQTVSPAEILYADDGSTDASVEEARRFEAHGVRVLPFAHCGVSAARNRAASESTGDFLLHVDGDNILAPDFIERHLDAIGPADAFAYCSKQYFDLSDMHWDAPAWNRDRLWQANFVDTSCLVRREVFEAVGGWKDTAARTMWDWDLALRLSRYGRGTPSGALLYYRHHSDNWSLRREGTERDRRSAWKGLVRCAAARMTVCTVYSGRLPRLFPVWLDGLCSALDPGERERPELFVIDDSPQGFYAVAAPHLARLERLFQSVRVARVYNGENWEMRRPDRAATSRFLSIAYNRFLDETDTEVLWFVEDDIVVPCGAAGNLLHLLLDGENPRAAVTGMYKSRHEDCFVISRLENGHPCHAVTPPDTPAGWDLAGTGCLMVFRPRAKAVFHPWWRTPAENGKPASGAVGVVPAHDWSYTWQLREQGDRVVSHPEVRCRHYLDAESWV